jgi:predicted CXXCH cytochrome family protein
MRQAAVRIVMPLVFFALVVTYRITVTAQVGVSSPSNPHNLSASGQGGVKSETTTEICIFCHAPHNSSPAPPLWNQLESGATYTAYSSSTMAASPGAPTGSAKLCLSCHDGTVAIGATLSRGRIEMSGVDAAGRMTGAAALGANLSDDHPISFVPVPRPEIGNPPAGDAVQLDRHGMLQCRTCHDPHEQENDPVTKKFLVKSNSASALCLTCHQKAYWSTTPNSHRTSTRSYTRAQGAHTGYTTVATNGCESCHKPHTATAATRMLTGVEENTCNACHGPSGVASTNMAIEFAKTYRHPVYSITPSVHDAAESPASGTFRVPETSASAARHVECADCHNAHASHPSGSPPSVREYEICYKCHADSANKSQPGGPDPPYANREALQFNKRLQFDPANPSYHPIEAPGRSTSVPSLIPPWTTSSVMYCTDCHNNDTGPKAPTPGRGPAGPHGSSHKHLLVARYEMDSGTSPESPTNYALCYKCHSRTSILNDESFNEHQRHVVGAGAPCSVCHDPHGIPAEQGTTTNNSRLINFDRRFVTPTRSGLLRFEATGQGSSQCYLTCHGKEHVPVVPVPGVPVIPDSQSPLPGPPPAAR